MLIIDRFEGEWAVIEYNNLIFNLPRSLLPGGAREGDVIQVSVIVDKKATSQRKKGAESLLDNFFDE